jgi:hypothetical protein
MRRPPRRHSTSLTLRLIDEISASVEVFKPSASLHALSLASQQESVDLSSPSSSTYIDSPTTAPQKPVAEIDLVVSGGGLKCYFACGALSVLQQHLLNQNIRIARVAGSSAGAWSALFIATGLSTDWWIESYHFAAEAPGKTLHEVYEHILVRRASPAAVCCMLDSI